MRDKRARETEPGQHDKPVQASNRRQNLRCDTKAGSQHGGHTSHAGMVLLEHACHDTVFSDYPHPAHQQSFEKNRSNDAYRIPVCMPRRDSEAERRVPSQR
jgi:hypothetical protein